MIIARDQPPGIGTSVGRSLSIAKLWLWLGPHMRQGWQLSVTPMFEMSETSITTPHFQYENDV